MKEITFNPPITVNGKKLSTITLRQSTVGDEEDAQVLALTVAAASEQIPVPLTSEICLFATLTGISYDDIRRLRPHEYALLRQAYDEVNSVRPTEPEGEKTEEAAPVDKPVKSRSTRKKI